VSDYSAVIFFPFVSPAQTLFLLLVLLLVKEKKKKIPFDGERKQSQFVLISFGEKKQRKKTKN